MPSDHINQARRLVVMLTARPDTRRSTDKARQCFLRRSSGRTMARMSRLPRAAAVHVGEFALGVAVAYAAVGGAFALTQAVLPMLAVAVVMIALAVAAEVHWGP